MYAPPRPRMKLSSAVLRGAGELHVVRSDDVVSFDDPDGAMHRLVELADGSRDTTELFHALAPEYPSLKHHHVVDAVDRLEAAGVLETRAPRHPIAGRIGGAPLARL